MKIRFDQPFKLVSLHELAPGDMFRDENNEGLFLKTVNGSVVVRPPRGDDVIDPGRESGFDKQSKVIRIKQIIVFPEIV